MVKSIKYLLVGGLLLTSCHKEYFQLDKLSDEMELETDLVAPLIHGSMSLGDLVARFDSSDYTGEFEDGLIYLSYSDTLVEVMVDTLDLVIDGFYNEFFIDVEIGDDPVYIGSAIGDTVHFRKSKFFGFETEGENRMDSVLFKGGELETVMGSSFQHTGFLTLSSTYIKDSDGNPYSHTIEINDASGNFTWSEIRDLEGFFLETDKQGDSSVFRMDYDLALINSGNPVNPGDQCDISSNFTDMGFYKLFGYVDPEEVVSEIGELDIPIFADNPDLRNLQIADPRITVAIENSLGIPFELTVDSLIAIAEDGSRESLVFYEGHPFIIPAPEVNMIGETVSGEYYINNQTSNFRDLINLAPSTLSYGVSGNSGGQSQSHFLLDTSRFMAEAEFVLPLDLSISEYTLTDTMEFSVGEGGIDTSLVKEVVVSVFTINELPLELSLQIYLLDESYAVLDSLFDGVPPLLPSSEVDLDGRLVSASEKDNRISFPTERLGILEQISYLRVEARIVSAGSGDQFVKFYSDYSLDFEISFFANFRINTREL